MTPIEQTPNLGPRSAEMLTAAGIHSFEELKELGAVLAFLRVQQSARRPSLNLLWAMQGAIVGKRWDALTKQEKERLLKELSDAQAS